MTNTALLRNRIDYEGKKYKKLASELGVTPYCLQKKIDNISEFKASEIAKISSSLKLTIVEREQIFFAQYVELNSTY